MEHTEVLPECKIKFEEADKHIAEGRDFRDLVIKHETELKTVCTDIESIKKWIFGSSAAIILTIILATLGLAVTWGRTLEKVERLDRIHQGPNG